MKDLEMAEAQIKKWDSLLYPQMYPVALVKDFIRKAYLEGLEAGRPKWHKVADGDLPKDNNLVLIQMVNGNTTMGLYYVNTWREICNCKELTGVYAWCETPQYKE